MMDHQANQKSIIIGLTVASFAYGVVEILAALKEQVTSAGTDYLWSIVFAIVIALWTSNDAKQKGLYEPYEFSYFAFLFWPFVLPYHLVKTRGSEGFLMFLGALIIYVLPFLLGLVTWAYS